MESKVNIIIFGPPGSGKGTQSHMLAARYNLVVVSTGDLLRSYASSDTELGIKVKEVIQSGALVQDDLICSMIDSELRNINKNFILDGFPRNLYQAKFLTKVLSDIGLDINVVLKLHVRDEVLLNRIKGRLFCEKCGRVYNVDLLFNIDNFICGGCGFKSLKRRYDDNDVNIIYKRIEKYNSEIEELENYYRDKLIVINGENSIDIVNKSIIDKIEFLN